jgi:hypothetical protein
MLQSNPPSTPSKKLTLRPRDSKKAIANASTCCGSMGISSKKLIVQQRMRVDGDATGR